MANSETIKGYIDELKNCPPADVSKVALRILESFVFLERGEMIGTAETIYKWAKKHAGSKRLHYAYAKLMHTFSLYYTDQFDDALPLLVETENLFDELHDTVGAAICITLQGSIYRTFGNFDLALKALWKAHDELKRNDLFHHFLLGSSVTIGGIYFDMKQYDEAVPLFKDSLEIAEKWNAFYWIIYSLHGLGKVYLMQNKYPEAKECLEKAMAVAEKNNHPLSVCNSLSELGNYYFTTGDYLVAEQFHHRSLALREQNNFAAGAITSCIRLGEIYIRQSKTEEAIAILNKGLKMAEQLKVKLKMYQIHYLLSEIYEQNNDPVKSLAHYKQFHELRDQVEVEDNTRRIKNAQLVFEAEQTKKENIIIKKQKEEIEKKNIELQETIDELTRARIGRKARAITLVIAIVMFIMEDTILHFALIMVPEDNYLISMIVKMVIIFSLNPINKAVENYLLNKVVKKEKKAVLV